MTYENEVFGTRNPLGGLLTPVPAIALAALAGSCGGGGTGGDDVLTDGIDAGDGTDAPGDGMEDVDLRDDAGGDGHVWAEHEDCEGIATASCTTDCGSTGLRVCTACTWEPGCTRSSEVCNGADDDCVGGCDDGFACCLGATRPCSVTACSGAQTCEGGCLWGPCDLGVAPPHDTCPGAASIRLGSTTTGSTCGAANEWSSACIGRGPDVFYRLAIGSRSLLTVGVTSIGGWDPEIALLGPVSGSECPGREIRCVDDVGGDPDPFLQITVDAGTYYLLVDGSGVSDGGAFTLVVSTVPAP